MGIEEILKDCEDYNLNTGFDKIMKYLLGGEDYPELTSREKLDLTQYIYESKDPLVLRWREIEKLKGKKVDRQGE